MKTKVLSKSPFSFLCQLEDYQVQNIHRLIQRSIDTRQNELLEDVATFIGIKWLLELYGGQVLVDGFYCWAISVCVADVESDVSKQRAIMEARKILRDFLKRRNETVQKRPPLINIIPASSPSYNRPRSKTEMPNSRLESSARIKKSEKKTYNILLIGESGSGKTTLINGFYNYCRYSEMPANGAPILIDCSSLKSPGSTVGRKEGRNEQLRRAPPTTKSCVYSMEISREEELNIIDTPDINNVRSRMEIMRFLKESRIEKIHAICLLLRPDELKLTPSLCFYLNILFSVLPKCAAKNIFFCFSQYNPIPGEILGIIHSYLEALKYERKTDFSFQDAKVFSFDNSCLRNALSIVQNSQLENISGKLWKRNVLTTRKMIKAITKLAPFPKEIMLDCNRFSNDAALKTREYFQIIAENRLFGEADRVFLMLLLLVRIHLYMETNQLVYQGDKITKQLLNTKQFEALETFASLVHLHRESQREGRFSLTGREIKATFKQVTMEDYTASCKSEKL